MADRTISVELRALTDQYKRNMAAAGTATRQTGVHAAGTQRAMGGMYGAVRRLIPVLGVAGLARAAQQAVRHSVELESSLTKMETLVGLTSGEVGELSSGFGDLSAKTGIANQELADAAFFISSAGLRGSEALDALEASATAAAIGLGDTRVVADLVTSAMNAYGDENLSAAQATDILVGAVREGKAEAPELAAAMGRVLPIASEMGVSFDEVGAAIAAMTRTGSDAATATTQLRGILMALLRPSEQAEAALREYGLSGEMMRETLQEKGLLATLQLLTDTFDGNQEALARVIPRSEGLLGLFDLMGANVEDTIKIFGNMTDVTNLSAEALERYQETTEFQLNRASANWADFKVQVADTTLPAINYALQDFNKTMERGFLASFGELFTGSETWAQPFYDFFDRLVNDVRWSDWFTGDAGVWAPDIDVSGVTFGLSEAEEAFLSLNGQMGNTPPAANAAADAIDGVGDSADDTRTSIERLNDNIDALIGVNLNAEKAAIRVEQGFDDLNETLQASTKIYDENDEVVGKQAATLDRSTEAGRENERAIIAQAEAILDEIGARHRQGDSLAEISVLYGRQVDRLKDVMRQAGLTEAEIESYIQTLGLTPDAVVTTVQAETGRATSAVEAFIRATGRIPRFTHTTVTFGVNARDYNRAVAAAGRGTMIPIHTGGYIHPSGKLQRFHTGGMVGGGGLKSDEVPAILQTGEMVLSRQQVAQIGDAFSGRGDGFTSGSGLTVNQTFNTNPDRSTLAEARHQQRLAFLEAV